MIITLRRSSTCFLAQSEEDVSSNVFVYYLDVSRVAGERVRVPVNVKRQLPHLREENVKRLMKKKNHE